MKTKEIPSVTDIDDVEDESVISDALQEIEENFDNVSLDVYSLSSIAASIWEQPENAHYSNNISDDSSFKCSIELDKLSVNQLRQFKTRNEKLSKTNSSKTEKSLEILENDKSIFSKSLEDKEYCRREIEITDLDDLETTQHECVNQLRKLRTRHENITKTNFSETKKNTEIVEIDKTTHFSKRHRYQEHCTHENKSTELENSEKRQNEFVNELKKLRTCHEAITNSKPSKTENNTEILQNENTSLFFKHQEYCANENEITIFGNLEVKQNDSIRVIKKLRNRQEKLIMKNLEILEIDTTTLLSKHHRDHEYCTHENESEQLEIKKTKRKTRSNAKNICFNLPK